MKIQRTKRLAAWLIAVIFALTALPSGLKAVFADDVNEIGSAAELSSMSAGEYRLTSDIVLEDWSPAEVGAGVILDGDGHTLTLCGTPLFDRIEDGAVIKNLILDGAVTSESSVGSFAVINNGTIRNCASYADVTYSGTGGYDWLPDYAAGLVGSFSAVTGTLSGCLYAGELDTGSAPLYGTLANFQFFAEGTIENCVGVGSDRIGMSEGISSNTVIDTGSNVTLTTLEEFSPEEYVDTFNSVLEDGDLPWSVEDGVLAPRKSGGEIIEPEADEADLALLSEAISAAKAVDLGKLYTAQSFGAFKTALEKAEGIDAGASPKKSAVAKAAEELSTAIDGLCERKASSVDLSDKDVTPITSVAELEGMTSGGFYRLDKDLEITTDDWWFGYFNDMDCVLDGGGHTITLSNDKPLWNKIGENGVVQNLGIKGSVSNTNDFGVLAAECAGVIVNCFSQADVKITGYNDAAKNAGGFVAAVVSGGAIINSYVSGTVSAKGLIGAVAGRSEENTQVKNCVWLDSAATDAVGENNSISEGLRAFSRAEFYDRTAIDVLNGGRDEFSKEWTLSDEGFPHLGDEGSFTPPEDFVTLSYTSYYGGDAISFKNTDGINISLAEAAEQVGTASGRFKYPDCECDTAWVPQTVSGGANNVLVSEDGELFIYGAESIEVVVYDKASWSGTQYEKELTRFTVNVSEIAADALKISVGGEHTSENGDGSYTVEGSAVASVGVFIEIDGTWRNAQPLLFDYDYEGDVFSSRNTFYASKPGKIKVTVSGMGQSASAEIISEYVPVEKITPAPSGEYVIHERNANSERSGSFLDLTLSHGAGTVVVEPDNASYRDNWELISDAPDVAEYISSFVRAVLPYRAGEFTLKAVSTDPELTEEVSGTSKVKISYFNPITDVSVSESEFTVKENESIDLPITFVGERSAEGYHVTEPDMVWSFEGDGEVEISRDSLGVLTRSELEYCIANDKFKLTGISEGTVFVTGTPVDGTNSPSPIEFTVTVVSGKEEAPVDCEKLAKDAADAAVSRLLDLNADKSYAYGDEWDIFALCRSGIATGGLDEYLNSVEQAYKSPSETELKPTTVARVILALGAAGEDASDFRGLNLPSLLYNSDRITEGGNEPVWALIALDSLKFDVPSGAKWSRETLVSELLEKYYNAESGGFGLEDNISCDADVTAMAVQALAPYVSENEAAADAVENALGYLKNSMNKSCDFGTSETGAQVLVALAALGMDPADIENGFAASTAKNILTGLYAYRAEDGGFKHLPSDGFTTKMSTIQALCGFNAYLRFAGGENSLYDLTDSTSIKKTTTVRLRIEGSTENIFDGYVSAKSDGAATVEDVLNSLAEEGRLDIEMKDSVYGGKYITGIAGEREGHFGGYDGWLFRINGRLSDYGISYAEVSGGDEVLLYYGDYDMLYPEIDTSRLNSDGVIRFTATYTSYSQDESGNPIEAEITVPIADASVTWGYGQGLTAEYKTNENGEVTIPQSRLTNGAHKLQIEKCDAAGKPLVIRLSEDSAVTVTVSGQGGGSAGGVSAGTAYFTLTGDDPHGADGHEKYTTWIYRTAVSLDDCKTVGDAFKKVLNANGYTYTGLEDNYIKSITTPDGVTLSEFTNGKNSGWLYTVNGKKPSVGLNDYILKNGDSVNWYYSDDYTSASGTSGGGSGGNSGTAKKEPAASDKPTTEPSIADGAEFSDIDGHWAKEYIEYLSSVGGIIKGKSEGVFAPDDEITRAEFLAVLARLSGDEMPSPDNRFLDVSPYEWYAVYAAWGVSREIVNGISESEFSPDAYITRQDMSVMLSRYLEYIGAENLSGGGSEFADDGEIADYAKDAVYRLKSIGAIDGRGGNMFVPLGTATRAEASKIIAELLRDGIL